jgi:hypothetical protein
VQNLEEDLGTVHQDAVTLQRVYAIPGQTAPPSAVAEWQSVLGVRLMLPCVEGIATAVWALRDLFALGDVHALVALLASEVPRFPGIFACVGNHLSVPPVRGALPADLRATARVLQRPRPGLAIRAQAFGEALDPDRLDKLARYEVHLDRKLERILGMLIRLQALRSTITPDAAA